MFVKKKNKSTHNYYNNNNNMNGTLGERNRITQLIKIQIRKSGHAPNHSFHNIFGAGNTGALFYAIIAARLQQTQQQTEIFISPFL